MQKNIKKGDVDIDLPPCLFASYLTAGLCEIWHMLNQQYEIVTTNGPARAAPLHPEHLNAVFTASIRRSGDWQLSCCNMPGVWGAGGSFASFIKRRDDCIEGPSRLIPASSIQSGRIQAGLWKTALTAAPCFNHVAGLLADRRTTLLRVQSGSRGVTFDCPSLTEKDRSVHDDWGSTSPDLTWISLTFRNICKRRSWQLPILEFWSACRLLA